MTTLRRRLEARTRHRDLVQGRLRRLRRRGAYPAVASITAAEVARQHRDRGVESPARADGALRVLRAVERYSKAAAAARGETLNVDLLAMVRAGRRNNVAPSHASRQRTPRCLDCSGVEAA